MKLYELTQNYRNLENLADQEGLTIEMIKEALGQVQEDINIKIENTCKVIKEVEADTIGIDEEIKRLGVLKKQKENLVKGLKGYIENEMNSINLNKVEGKLFKVSFRKSKAVNIIDQSKLEERFINRKVTETANKKEIMAAIKNGEIIDGAELIENKSLQIK